MTGGADRFPLLFPDGSWEKERDAAFAAFVSQRLTHVDAHGCQEERKLASGIRDVFHEWNGARELARTSDNDEFTGRVDALGWALRCLADPAWRDQPGWDATFAPKAVAPAGRKEVPS